MDINKFKHKKHANKRQFFYFSAKKRNFFFTMTKPRSEIIHMQRKPINIFMIKKKL